MATKSTIFNNLILAAAFLLFGSTVLHATNTTVSTYEALASAVNNDSPLYDTIFITQRITLPNGANLDGEYGNKQFKVIQAPVPYIDADGMQNTNPSPYGVFTIEKNSTVTLKHLVIMGGGCYPFNNSGPDNSLSIEQDSYKCGAIQNEGTLNMEFCTIQRSYRGIRNMGQLVMKYCKLIRNVCKFGSGLLNEGDKAQNSPGLGAADTKVVMDCCSFSENYAANDGGAAENKKGAVMYFNNTIMANNIGNISAINNWNGYLYFMNSTITGNITTTTSYDFAVLVGYGMWAVNSILVDNKTINGGLWTTPAEGEVNARSNTFFSGCKAHLYNCIYGQDLSKIKKFNNEIYVETINCKENQGVGSGVFQDYLETGIYIPRYVLANNTNAYPQKNYFYYEGPRTSVAFNHSALVHNENHTISAPAAVDGLASTGGCETYFNYKYDANGKLQVYMGYKDDPDDAVIQTLGNSAMPSGGFDEDMKVTTYSDGTKREGTTMGPSTLTDARFYTLTLAGLTYGTCKINGASLYGDTYPENTVLTVELIPSHEEEAPFTEWIATGITLTEEQRKSKKLTITMNNRITLQPKFAITNFNLKFDLQNSPAKPSDAKKTLAYTILSPESQLPTPEWATHRFTGWSGTGIDGITLDPVIFPTGSFGNKEFVANWEAIPVVNPDPDETKYHYGTFYVGGSKYRLPSGVSAYTAAVEGDAMVMHKVAEPGDILPASTAVILKADQDISTITSKTVALPYLPNETPITITADNDLRGVDADSVVNKLKGYKSTDTYYILSGGNEDGDVTGLGFYKWRHDKTIPAHKAYIRIPQPPASAPARLRFDFSQAEGTQVATDIEDTHTQHENGTRKELRNGQLIIIRDEQVYTIHGLRIQ